MPRLVVILDKAPMKNHIHIARTCLSMLSLLCIASIAFAVIRYSNVSELFRPMLNVVDILVIPCVIEAALGLAFHYCAKFLKRGSTKAWTWSVILLSLSLLNAAPGTLLNGFSANDGVLRIAIQLGNVALPVIALWALLQPGSRTFVKSGAAASASASVSGR